MVTSPQPATLFTYRVQTSRWTRGIEEGGGLSAGCGLHTSFASNTRQGDKTCTYVENDVNSHYPPIYY